MSDSSTGEPRDYLDRLAACENYRRPACSAERSGRVVEPDTSETLSLLRSLEKTFSN